MGKPLGLGSVRITSRLQLVDRAARYRAWQGTGEANEDGSRFRAAFVAAMLGHARASSETLLANQEGLRQIGRLDALYQMLRWSGRPARNSTAYMVLKRFQERPVLPTPHALAGSDEPAWRNDPPRTGSSAVEPAGSRSAPREVAPDSRPIAVPTRAPAVKPVEKGQTRKGVLKRRDNSWVARFEGDSRDGQIDNPRAIPGECADGTMAEFYITEQSKRGGIRCRFERIIAT
jgi:hypothetical protein